MKYPGNIAGGYHFYLHECIAFCVICFLCLVTTTSLIAVSLLLSLAIIILLVCLSYKSVKKDEKEFKNDR